MNYLIFFSIFVILGLFYLLFGYQAAQKLKTLDDYFLAQRNLGIMPLAIALIAVHFGSGVIIGTSDDSFHIGLYGLHYVVGISLGFIILAFGVASRMRSLEVTTTAEIFTKQYHSRVLTVLASLVSIASLIGILLAQMVGTRELMTSLGLYSPWLFCAFWAIIVAYTMAGGLSAIVKSNVFQITFIICVFLSIFGYELYSNFDMVAHAFSQPDIFQVPDIFSIHRIITIVAIPACYTLIEQDVAQNIFAARSQRIALISAFIASIFMLLFSCIPAYFGMKTRLLGITLPEGANPLLYIFDQQYSSLVVILAVYGIFAASISTADTILCAITSHVVEDFNLRTSTDKGNVRLAQVITLTIGLVAMVWSFYATRLLDILINSYMIPIATIFIPLIVAYFTPRVSRYAAYASVIAGGGSLLLFKAYGSLVILPPEAASLIVSGIAYGITWILASQHKRITQ